MQVDLLSSKVLWVGIGCQKGISSRLISAAIEAVFHEYQLNHTSMAGIATIDIKASEFGLREFCRIHNLPLKTFTSEILAGVCVPNPGEIITETVGTPSVAEAAAILATSYKTAEVTLLVPKQIFRLPGETGALTIAVAVRGKDVGI